ncbi:MAG: NAD(P)/FAD-dependent oxidoreductase [Candidatus Bipolaricaulis sp.]|nr:NAD(P)/FAD-dependent oxidoreductase [Candidatus Bipolaricaulis sp.]
MGNGRSIYDVIVVGGGMAGLTASAFAARAGCSVLLCDKEATLGGLIHSFERDGFTWDAGIRALEDSGIILPMLESLGISVDFVRSPVSLGIEDRVIPVESPANLADYQALLEHLYPDSRADIVRIIKAIRRVMKHMAVLYGVENPAFKDLAHDREYVFKKLLPWLGRFLLTIGKINRMAMPVEEHLKTLSCSRPLIDIISQHFFKNTPAFFALSYFSLYLDYIYPMGGTGALPRAVEAYCAAEDVEIRKQTRIAAVGPVAHTVADESGAVYGYRKLVWAADLKTLYKIVDLKVLPGGGAGRRARKRAALVDASFGGDSVFTLYLAADIEPAWFAAKSNGHFFYTPSRKGVGCGMYSELETMLAGAVSDEDEGFRAEAEKWVRRYIASTTFEISIPVLKDASLAPAGKTGLIISVLFDYALCVAARTHGWYEGLKILAEDSLIDSLDATIYPGLRDAVRTRFSFTPLSIAQVIGSSEGAITGWAFTNPTVPAVNRMQRVSRSVLTALPDVFQAGQWAYSPSGLPMAILTGKLAADRVARELRKRRARGK